jgi:acyl-coenzyme A thioesterase PaaI-like protein
MTSNRGLKKLKWQLFLLGVFKIPMIGFVRPRLVEINDSTVKVKVKLNRRTKNHLKSMYFGALTVGADIAGGIYTFYYGDIKSVKLSFSFKDMKADFIKRAETDILFVCNDGVIINQMIENSIKTKERQNQKVTVTAFNEKQEVVALFELGVSLKVK